MDAAACTARAHPAGRPAWSTARRRRSGTWVIRSLASATRSMPLTRVTSQPGDSDADEGGTDPVRQQSRCRPSPFRSPARGAPPLPRHHRAGGGPPPGPTARRRGPRRRASADSTVSSRDPIRISGTAYDSTSVRATNGQSCADIASARAGLRGRLGRRTSPQRGAGPPRPLASGSRASSERAAARSSGWQRNEPSLLQLHERLARLGWLQGHVRRRAEDRPREIRTHLVDHAGPHDQVAHPTRGLGQHLGGEVVDGASVRQLQGGLGRRRVLQRERREAYAARPAVRVPLDDPGREVSRVDAVPGEHLGHLGHIHGELGAGDPGQLARDVVSLDLDRRLAMAEEDQAQPADRAWSRTTSRSRPSCPTRPEGKSSSTTTHGPLRRRAAPNSGQRVQPAALVGTDVRDGHDLPLTGLDQAVVQERPEQVRIGTLDRRRSARSVHRAARRWSPTWPRPGSCPIRSRR